MSKNMKRAVSLMLCALLMIGNFTGLGVKANAGSHENAYGGTSNKIADPGTLNTWKDVFKATSTEHAGGVWTDKSVFNSVEDYIAATDENDNAAQMGLKLTDPDNFLVALSVIASSKGVEGYDTLPSDTILVLDLSGSMQNSGSVAPMITAANNAITRLLELNANNRVGVVAYSGNTQNGNSNTGTAKVILPLGRYTAQYAGRYLTSSWVTGSGWTQTRHSGIKVDNGVAGTFPTGISANLFSTDNNKDAKGGTYIQNGLYQAWGQFDVLDESETVVKDGLQMGVERKPIIVLMTDGNPTTATTNYTNIGTSNQGDGSENYETKGIAFLTQLTASWVRDKVEEKYNNEPLFYTLGLDVESDDDRQNGSPAESVLAPDQFQLTDDYWQQFIALKDQQNKSMEILIRDAQKDEIATVTYVPPVLESGWTEDYVDEYFPASDSQGLINAFSSIVDHIVIQSLYYPTDVDEGGDINQDGFVDFEDYIGKNMEVKAIKGIQLGDRLYDGHTLAKMMYEGGMGTVSNPTDVGNELVWSVQKRLGIDSVDGARVLLDSAWQHGQLAYNPTTGAYSNYIGWYADGDGKYKGFWDGNEDTMHSSAPAGAVFAIKSYGFYDAVGEGHRATDMMYATIQVRTNLVDNTGIDASKAGDIRVIGRLPASLIPLIEYDIEVRNSNPMSPESLTVTGATAPSRLLYEVGLKDGMDPLNMAETAKDPLETDADGNYVFYTNQWHEIPSEGYAYTVNKNTTAYFEPSEENERYYYNADMPVFTNRNGTNYTGNTAPASNGTYYRRYIVYTKNGNTVSASYVYEEIPEEVLADSSNFVKKGNSWIVKKGVVYRYDSDRQVQKTANHTGTLIFSENPFWHPSDVGDNKLGNQYHMDAYLGNNGKLILASYEGIKISKSVDSTLTDPSAVYTFTITAEDSAAFNAACTLIKEDAAGNRSEGTTITFADGVASVTLKAGETAYILGSDMIGKTFVVSENAGAGYEVESVNADTDAETAEITVESHTIHSAAFVNTKAVNGSVVITKQVVSPHTEHETEEFAFTVTVDAANSTLAEGTELTAVRSDGKSYTASVDSDKKAVFAAELMHGQALTIDDLPAGVVVTAVEADYMEQGFTTVVNPGDGKATVAVGQTKYIDFANGYAAASTVPPTNIAVNGKKVLASKEEWSGTFTFALQRLENESWKQVGEEQTVSYAEEKGERTFGFSLEEETYAAAGVYSYRVIEVIPDAPASGVTYDRVPAYFDVTVSDDHSGKLYVSNVVAGNDAIVTESETEGVKRWDVEVDFHNSYNVTGEVTATLNIDKVVTNTDANGDSYGVTIPSSGFRFALYEADADYAVDANAEPVQISAPTNAMGDTLIRLTYTQSDEHYYVLKEVQGSDARIDYSEAEYCIYVNVTDDNQGNLVIMMNVYDHAQTLIWTSVQNHQTDEAVQDETGDDTTGGEADETGDDTTGGEADETGDDPTGGEADESGDDTTGGEADESGDDTTGGEADETGDDPTGGEVDETGDDPTGGEVDETGDDTTGGEADESGDDTTGGEPDETGDDDKKRSADGSAVSITDTAVVVENVLNFENKFTPTAEKTDFAASKTLTGRDMIEGEFTLALYETGSNFVVAAGAEPIDTKAVTEQASGAASHLTFAEQSYSKVGTHYYVIREEIPADAENNVKAGVAYDAAQYHITVTVTGDNTTGDLHVSKTITRNGRPAQAIAFSNTYTAEPVTDVVIKGDKTMVGNIRKLQAGMFMFELKDESGRVVQTVGNGIPDITGYHAEVKFAPLTFNAPGTYTYTVKEVLPAGDTALEGNKYLHNGVVYDAQSYTVTVTVADNGQGQLAASVAYSGNGSGFAFVNEYKVEPTDINLGGEKRLTGDALKNRDFIYELYAASYVDQQNPYVQGDKLASVTHDAITGAFSFTHDQVQQLNFTSIGAYRFIIKEQVPDNADPLVDYDESIYYVEVVVTDKGDGTLLATPHYLKLDENGNQTAVRSIVFENVVKPEPVKVTLTGKKHYNKDITADDAFIFDLYQAAMKEGSIEAIGSPILSETLTIDSENRNQGTFTFEDAEEVGADGVVIRTDYLTYTEPGTYYFVIKEHIPDGANAENGYTVNDITYSTKEYKITVTVELSQDSSGRETLKETVLVDGEPNADITFINTHHAHDTDGVVIMAEKILNGKDLSEMDVDGHGGFEFTLYEAAVNGDEVTRGNKVESVYNSGEAVYFSEIMYSGSESKTYYYMIEEVIPAAAENNKLNGVTYDAHKYLVKVDTTYNNGTLTTAAPVYMEIGDDGKIGNTVELVEFVNEYTLSPLDLIAVVPMDGDKTLQNGPAMTDGQFTFKLYAADEYWNPVGSEFLTAQNIVAADGTSTFTFSNKADGSDDYIIDTAPFVVNTAGTYRFVIAEEPGADANIQYDAAQYRVEVVVQDKGDGTLAIAQTNYVKAAVVDGTTVESTVDETGIHFVNIYTPDPICVQIAGKKILKDYKGNEVDLDNKVFRFAVYEADSTYAVAEGAQPIAEAVNDANGAFGFELPVDHAGNWYYVIRELDTSAYADINNDPTQFHVMVEVSLDADGSLQASTPVIKVGDKDHALQFINTYDRPDPASIMVELEIKKDLMNQNAYGKDLSGFKFELVDADNMVVDTAESDRSGKALLYAAEFDMSDAGKTFTYTVREVNTGISNMVYSARQYKVEITIGYDSDSNSLFAVIEKDDVVLQKGEPFMFTNVYNPPHYPNDPDDPKPDPGRPSSPKTGDESSWPWILMLIMGIMGLCATTVGMFTKPRKVRR